MIDLTPSLIAEKNKIESAEAWLVLITLTRPSDVTPYMYLVNNNEDITIPTKNDDDTVTERLYQAFPFELTDIVETSSGGLPSFTLKVSNIDRVVQKKIEEDIYYYEDNSLKSANFGSGWDVKVSVVSSTQIGGVSIPEIEFNAKSLNVTCDRMWANFSCGVNNPMMKQFPRQKFSSNFCQRTFKDGEACTYSGSDTTCSKTLTACKEKFPDGRVNSNGDSIGLPFLAFQGIPSSAIR